MHWAQDDSDTVSVLKLKNVEKTGMKEAPPGFRTN